MIQLTYISSQTDRFDGDVPAILAVSRRNNARIGVTGVLLFDGRRFLQTIEGEPAVIDALIDRLKQDDRHRAIVVLSRREITVRSFADWSMAYRDARTDASGDLAAIVAPFVANADASTRALFESFAQIRRAA